MNDKSCCEKHSYGDKLLDNKYMFTYLSWNILYIFFIELVDISNQIVYTDGANY